MGHELIIIIKTDDDGNIPRQTDHGYDFNNINVYSMTKGMVIKLDGYPLGWIQNLNIEASSDTWPPKIEITFPDLDSATIDPNLKIYAKMPPGSIKEQVEDLKAFKDIKVLLKDYSTCMDDSIEIREIGTDGIIDKIDIW